MNFTCPKCGVILNRYDGERVHPGNPAFGVTLDCGNHACSSPEVTGHGSNEKQAYISLMDKFARGKVGEVV